MKQKIPKARGSAATNSKKVSQINGGRSLGIAGVFFSAMMVLGLAFLSQTGTTLNSSVDANGLSADTCRTIIVSTTNFTKLNVAQITTEQSVEPAASYLAIRNDNPILEAGISVAGNSFKNMDVIRNSKTLSCMEGLGGGHDGLKIPNSALTNSADGSGSSRGMQADSQYYG